MITAAIILAEAAVIHEGRNAIQSQSYGPEARGGATSSGIIISDSEIFFPKVNQPNVLVCLTQESYNKFHTVIRPGGLLITDTRFVQTSRKVDARPRDLPLHYTVMEKIGKPIVLNICMLGAVVGMTNLVKAESILKVLEKRIPSNFMEMNRKALELGINMGKELAS